MEQEVSRLKNKCSDEKIATDPRAWFEWHQKALEHLTKQIDIYLERYGGCVERGIGTSPIYVFVRFQFPAATKKKCNEVAKDVFPCSLCDSLVIEGVCVSCGETSCEQCWEHFNGEHHCDKEILDSVRTIKKNTTACPKCKVRIQKAPNTCNQMYCTKCGTLFNNNTGEVEHTSWIHNPHALEAMRKKGERIGVGCGQHVIIPRRFDDRDKTDRKYACDPGAFLTKLVSRLNERRDIDYHELMPQTGDPFLLTRALYQCGEITDRAFKMKLIKIYECEEAKKEWNLHHRALSESLVDVLTHLNRSNSAVILDNICKLREEFTRSYHKIKVSVWLICFVLSRDIKSGRVFA